MSSWASFRRELRNELVASHDTSAEAFLKLLASATTYETSCVIGHEDLTFCSDMRTEDHGVPKLTALAFGQGPAAIGLWETAVANDDQGPFKTLAFARLAPHSAAKNTFSPHTGLRDTAYRGGCRQIGRDSEFPISNGDNGELEFGVRHSRNERISRKDICI